MSDLPLAQREFAVRSCLVLLVAALSAACPADPAPGISFGPRTDQMLRCEEGEAFACALVGEDLQHGKYGEKLPSSGLLYYEKACRGGVSVACYNGGWLSEELNASPGVTLSWFLMGCEMEDSFGGPACCLGAADMYKFLGNGRATESYLLRGCMKGDADGCAHAARAFEEGEFSEPDPERAAQLRARACKLGDEPSCAGGVR